MEAFQGLARGSLVLPFDSPGGSAVLYFHGINWKLGPKIP